MSESDIEMSEPDEKEVAWNSADEDLKKQVLKWTKNGEDDAKNLIVEMARQEISIKSLNELIDQCGRKNYRQLMTKNGTIGLMYFLQEWRKENLFRGLDIQYNECFQVLEKSKLPDFLKSFDEKAFMMNNPLIYTHKLATFFESSAEKQLNYYQKRTSLLVGVPGCGKSFAIYKHALTRLCLYFLPGHKLLDNFIEHAKDLRKKNPLLNEELFINYLHPEFLKVIVSRYIVLQFMQKLSWNLETLFFFQCTNILDEFDVLMYKFISSNHKLIEIEWDNVFVAIDDFQLYLMNHNNDILSQGGSLVYYFPCFAKENQIKMILSGTSLKIRDIEEWISHQRLPYLEIQSILRFECFDSTKVCQVSKALLGKVEGTLIYRIAKILQGRPRILMNFIVDCIIKKTISPKSLDHYVSVLTEDNHSDDWSLFNMWKYLFEGIKNDFYIEIVFRHRMNRASLLFQNALVRILLDSLSLDEESLGTSFDVYATQIKDIELCVFPYQHGPFNMNYYLTEPLTIMAGINYMMSSEHPRTLLWNDIDDRAYFQKKLSTLLMMINSALT